MSMVNGCNKNKVSIVEIGNYLIDLIEDTSNSYWKNKFKKSSKPIIHIAIMVQPYLSRILSGEKTIESRYSKKRIAPFKKIKPGDIVILKESGGDVVAIFEAGKVRDFQFNDQKDLLETKEKYMDRLKVDNSFWETKINCKYATLIDIQNLLKIPHFKINKANRMSWMVIKTNSFNNSSQKEEFNKSCL